MYQALAAALGLTAVIARVSLGYGPIVCGDPPPCGCEPVVYCDPCGAVIVEPTPPEAPGKLPAPAEREPAPPTPTPVAPEPAPPATNTFQSPPQMRTPAAPETPQPDLSEDEPLTETAPAEPPTPEMAEPPVAAEEPLRYSAPPAEEPAAPPATDPYAELFPPDPAASEPEASTTEPPATDETPAVEEEPTTPNYDDLFPPSSATEILSDPGGLLSDSPRTWTNARGHLLLTARVTKLTPAKVVVTSDDGMSFSLAYSELSDSDLSFLRRQARAREMRLAELVRQRELLADQGR